MIVQLAVWVNSIKKQLKKTYLLKLSPVLLATLLSSTAVFAQTKADTKDTTTVKKTIPIIKHKKPKIQVSKSNEKEVVKPTHKSSYCPACGKG